ncbi:3-phosphoshikimate 1-carboxyvinyltransferase [Demequina aurantiaca]|uniref:3-phosphoshikimate 1-carboxyvinyltransferase n=1 Tax=Demequina aurantiaca TaxID=676200 RepID=UPI003D342A63
MSQSFPAGVGVGEVWDAPTADAPLDATVDVPGSKSLTNRFLVLAALADAPVRISGGLRSSDSDHMIGALRAMGVGIDDSGAVWTVTPAKVRGGVHVECGLAGTVMRFVPPLVLLADPADGPVTFDAAPSAKGRPMAPLLDALRALGASVSSSSDETFPFTVTPPATVPTEVVVDASASSQFVTALLLTAPRLARGLTVRHVGDSLPSLPHIDMTCETLRDAGIQIDQPDERTWVVHPGPISLGDIRVEPDLSNAGPFMAAAVVAGGTVRIPGWPSHTTQPGAYYPHILEQMGATCSLDDGVMTVVGPTGNLYGIEADLGPAGEITPTIAAICALAVTPSRLTGIGHLRGHETDRLAAIATEITRLGGHCVASADALDISPSPQGLSGAVMASYHDHRMATFAAILGLTVPGIQVLNVGTTSKTMPDFPHMWQSMLGLSD